MGTVQVAAPQHRIGEDRLDFPRGSGGACSAGGGPDSATLQMYSLVARTLGMSRPLYILQSFTDDQISLQTSNIPNIIYGRSLA